VPDISLVEKKNKQKTVSKTVKAKREGINNVGRLQFTIIGCECVTL
jgi:hypothetical protein